jgi:hypothetical protein
VVVVERHCHIADYCAVFIGDRRGPADDAFKTLTDGVLLACVCLFFGGFDKFILRKVSYSYKFLAVRMRRACRRLLGQVCEYPGRVHADIVGAYISSDNIGYIDFSGL